MTISFKPTEKLVIPPVFGGVADNQFFVSLGGSLCQKVSYGRASIIAYDCGDPYADTLDFDPSDPITRILPHVSNIEF